MSAAFCAPPSPRRGVTIMGERCNFCGLPFAGDGLCCRGESICKERKAFEDGSSSGFDLGLAQGRADERAAVVAWLVRDVAPRSVAEDIAAAIERGEHLPKVKP